MRIFISTFFLLLAFTARSFSQYEVGPSKYYYDLKAAFDDINAGTVTGDIVLIIAEDSPQTETAILYESGHDSYSDYTSVTIRAATSGLTISGDIPGPLIELNNAANVIFDGSAGGSSPDLIITNTSTDPAASTIKLTESANNNQISYCIIKGAETGSTSGLIFFSTSSTGNGNDNNTIDHNLISADDAGRPINGIFSLGTSGRDNSGNEVSDNEFADLQNKGLNSYGINLGDNTSSWNILRNSFYETTDFVPTASRSFYAIYVNPVASGINFNVSGNYIGGSGAQCTGLFVKTNGGAFSTAFYGIYINVGTGTASTVDNNRIQKIAWTNSAGALWTGIHIEGGDVNIGTGTGNIIGDGNSNGSITVTNATSTSANVYGININGTGVVDCQKNTIGSITGANAAANGTNIYAINKTAKTGNTTISLNSIGSSTQANSIVASSICSGSGTQLVFGINCAGSSTITIQNNTIANLTNNTNNSNPGRRSYINGIFSGNGTLTLSGNTIHHLTISNGNNAANQLASICGMALTGATFVKNVYGNTIYELSNNCTSDDNVLFLGFSVIGIYHVGITTSTNTFSENFIHSLKTGTGLSNVYGIKIQSGQTRYYNNIISLGGSTNTQVIGIFENGSSGTNSLFFNTIYIGGTAPSGSTLNSYALHSELTGNTRDFRNNVLSNARSNSGGASGSHYALHIKTQGGTLTCDYNNYYVSGTGGILGYYAGNKVSLPIVTGQDASSFAVNPSITDPSSTDATKYTIGTDLIGISGSGIPTTDYALATRVNPTMGAWERVVNKWNGSSGTAWNDPNNWTGTAVPLENSNLIFDVAAVNDCYLNTNHAVNNITNSTSRKLVTNGRQLTINGTLTFSGGAQIDASSSSSTVVFAGTTAQSINGSDFASSKAYNISVSNASGVTVNSNFTIDNNLTINSGSSLTISAPYLLTVSGNISNSLPAGLVLKSTSNGVDAKLINNNVSVPATVELSLSGGTGLYGPIYHYFVPGIQSMLFDNSSVAACAASLGLTHFAGDLLRYNEPQATTDKNSGWEYFDGYPDYLPGSGFNVLSSTRGYNIHLTANNRMILTETLNGAAHTFNLSYTGTNPEPGWNLVGNPYPCNYDLTKIDALMNSDDFVDNTVYFNYEGGYGTYNVATGQGTLNEGSSTFFSNIMPPMQGFFVRARNTGRSLLLPVSGKTSASAQPSRSKSSSANEDNKHPEYKIIRLTLQDGTVKDETLVCFYDKATFGFDGDYDAYKLFETDAPFNRSGMAAKMFNIPSIYSSLSGINYAMNFVPEPESGITSIPLSVRIKRAGTYTIMVSDFENLNGTKVLLRHGDIDNVLGPGISYSFKSDTGTFNNFVLLFGETGETAIDKPPVPEFMVWYKNSLVSIKAPSDLVAGVRRVVIYDMQGKPVLDKDNVYITPEDIVTLSAVLNKGVYLVHIVDPRKQYVFKIVALE